MAYVLGLILADGAIEDVRKSSRTCYISLTSIEKPYLENIKEILHSTHQIYKRPARYTIFHEQKIFSKDTYNLRIGNKLMFQDLINLGVTPRKSLRMRFPEISEEYLPFLVRGYLDGDGCIYVSNGNKNKPRIHLIFTCGSRIFLEKLSQKLANVIRILDFPVKINSGNGAYQIRYSGHKAMQILSYLYRQLEAAPRLQRKYQTYTSYQCQLTER
ncbi:MAG: hypothetical protein UX91_C0001G0083 [Candidatus Amesbacteria bacterium GW2011_GWB1_47_19]|nr:MAG: hypothetical protein UW51_C0001G0083 [Candidatus Amesbacteria bacterium GW2011_GWA1_44_24]KKU32095.1 MAG: hypothetical protein UX46_C0001G0082 [Candidatus Amesbacteria bacterium GW2011_GWC1_46_24]KKU67779.1 MAG: hypothetical protein UX91_C0001G0083 [Candidatus Amesbacteria bacterium GW2011_GWB1_47_19]